MSATSRKNNTDDGGSVLVALGELRRIEDRRCEAERREAEQAEQAVLERERAARAERARRERERLADLERAEVERQRRATTERARLAEEARLKRIDAELKLEQLRVARVGGDGRRRRGAGKLVAGLTAVVVLIGAGAALVVSREAERDRAFEAARQRRQRASSQAVERARRGFAHAHQQTKDLRRELANLRRRATAEARRAEAHAARASAPAHRRRRSATTKPPAPPTIETRCDGSDPLCGIPRGKPFGRKGRRR